MPDGPCSAAARVGRADPPSTRRRGAGSIAAMSDAYPIRTATADTLREFVRPLEAAFAEPWSEVEFRDFLPTAEPDRVIAAFDGEVPVGTAGAYTFRLTVPGGEVDAAGVTLVGVVPSHRRRGILRSLMRHQLDDIRARHEPVAILWASEGAIYQRFGYGLATLTGGIRDRPDPGRVPAPRSDRWAHPAARAGRGGRHLRAAPRRGPGRHAGDDPSRCDVVALVHPLRQQIRARQPGPQVPGFPRARRPPGRLRHLPDEERLGRARAARRADRPGAGRRVADRGARPLGVGALGRPRRAGEGRPASRCRRRWR